MTELHAHVMTNSQAARLVSQSRTPLDATLDAIQHGRPLPDPSTRPADWKDALIDRALDGMSREAARLLYMGAKTALEADAEYRVLWDRTSAGPAVPWELLGGRAARLSRRLEQLGRTCPWPSVTPGSTAESGHSVALSCVELAETIRPNWEWLKLERGVVLSVMGRDGDAARILRQVSDSAFDYEVRYWSLRSLGAALQSDPAHADELAVRIDQLEKLASDDVATAYLKLEMAAMRHDESMVAAAQREIAEYAESKAPYWQSVLRRRQGVISSRAGLSEEAFTNWIGELGA